MKRDEEGRRAGKRVNIPQLKDDWSPDGNWAGENLAPTEDDDMLDDDECYNWVNNPIRQLFENTKNRYERSYLDKKENYSNEDEE